MTSGTTIERKCMKGHKKAGEMLAPVCALVSAHPTSHA
jgi:hypothetical protein